jgi:polynucleotide 5'-kinase involved in rRNA processing
MSISPSLSGCPKITSPVVGSDAIEFPQTVFVGDFDPSGKPNDPELPITRLRGHLSGRP